MEANTVTITIDRYEEFKTAEKKLAEPRSKTIITTHGWVGLKIIETDDECVENLANELKLSNERVKALEANLNTANEALNDIFKSTIWERLKRLLK
jgi:hypothetical protein